MKRYVCGRDCTLTLLQDNTYTPIPFVNETLRCVPLRFSLQDTLHETTYVEHINGHDIVGTFTSLLTKNTVLPLFTLLKGKSFDLVVKRGNSTVIYKNIIVKSFELRGRLDEHIYLKIEITTTKYSYVAEWEDEISNLTWQTETVFNLRHKDWESEYCRLDAQGIYYFLFSGKFSKVRTFTLTIHFPLPTETSIGRTYIENNTLEHIDFTLHKIFKIDFEQLQLVHDMFDVKTASEILVVRNYVVGNWNIGVKR